MVKPELKLVENTGSQLDAEALATELPPQQSEMPFAVVEGEPVTELPRDLYIPPDALQVFLEAFEGPLDLLLYLIRKQNLDILDIPIAEITRQYMQYIELMQDLQLELAGEYLLMAAMLAEIKSRMLLPRPSLRGPGRGRPARRAGAAPAGVRALQESGRRHRSPHAHGARHAAGVGGPGRAQGRQDPAAGVAAGDAGRVQGRAVARARCFRTITSIASGCRCASACRTSSAALREAAFMNFTQLFRPEEGRMGVTVTFIAVLELMREGLIEIVQSEAYGQIHVRTAAAARHLKLVESDQGDDAGEADAENEAALAQPAQPEEDEPGEPDVVEDQPAAGLSTIEDSMTSTVEPTDNPDPEASK